MKRLLTLHEQLLTAFLGLGLVFNGTAQMVFPQDVAAFPTEALSSQSSETFEIIQANPPAAVAAISVQSVASGDWSQPWVWDCGCVPGDQHDVTILASHTVTVSEDVSAVNLSVQFGGTLQVAEGTSPTISLLGDWDSTGEFIAEKSLVTFDGDVPQQILGETDFYKISIQNQSTVASVGLTNVYHTLFVSSELITNGNVVLKSSGVASSASLAPVMMGTITGELGLERTVVAPFTGWLTIGAPFQDADLSEWNDDFITTGFPGSDYPAYAFVSIRYYDESTPTAETAFLPVSNVTDTITPGLGYYMYANPGTYTVDVMASPVVGPFDFPVSFTDNGNPAQDGLNVLANPYPSNINWDAAGLIKSNMYDVVYVWDVGLNQFRTYSNGYGINGGTPLIRSGEAFWVQASGADPELSIHETAKVNADFEPQVNTGDQFLKLRMNGLGLGDELIIAFNEDATQDFDASLDAFKFFSNNAVLNLASVSNDNVNLAINNVPLAPEAFSVPIILTAQQAGEVNMEIQNIPNIGDRCIYIEDVVTGETYTLDGSPFITFNTEIVTQELRFLVHVGETLLASTQDVSCFAMNDGSIEVGGTGDGPWDYTWTDEEGNVVASETAITGNAVLHNLAPGVYTAEVVGNPVCDALTQVFVINEPEEILTSSTHSDIACNEIMTGQISVEFSGGMEPLTGAWSNGDTSTEITGLEAGTYVYTVTDANGCQKEEVVVIDAAPTVLADFDTDAQIVNLVDGSAAVSFTNTSVNATEFVWSFGDGSASSMDVEPTHIYTEAGAYIVTLDASNDQCDATYQSVIIVEEGMSVSDFPIDQSIDVFMQEGQIAIRFRHDDIREYQIEAYNLLGQQLITPMKGMYGNQMINIDQHYKVPVMLVSIRDLANEQAHTFKIIR